MQPCCAGVWAIGSALGQTKPHSEPARRVVSALYSAFAIALAVWGLSYAGNVKRSGADAHASVWRMLLA
jgi:hypothetical protein